MSPDERRNTQEYRAEDTLAEALDLVEDLDQWLLPPTQWAKVADLIAALISAADARDIVSIANATDELKLISPLRVKAMGEKPAEPPPPPIRDRLNHLVHALQAEPRREPADRSRDRDD